MNRALTGQEPFFIARCARGVFNQVFTAAQAGDLAAERKLLSLTEPWWRGCIRRCAPDQELLDELEGEAFLILHDLILRFDPARGVQPDAYLASTLPGRLWSCARKYRITRNRELSLDSLESLETGAACGDGYYACPADDRVLASSGFDSALDALPEADQVALRLSVTGYTSIEIAALIGSTPAASRKRLQRARQRLKRVIEKGGHLSH